MNKEMKKKLRRALYRCAERGEWWEPDGKPVIPAGWVHDLVVSGKIPGSDIKVHAKGVRVRGVAFGGSLDFEQAHLAVPMLLDAVELDERVVLEQATGGWISIANSQIAGVSAQQVKLEHSLDLSGSVLTASVDLDDAQIRGNLDCSKATLFNPGGKALTADGARIAGDLVLKDAFAAGEVRLVGATLGGQLVCGGANLFNPGGDALIADQSQIAQSVFLNSAFTANGQVRMLGAHIEGQLSCRDGRFSNPDAIGLRLQEATISSAFFWQPEALSNGTRVDLRTCSIGPLVDDIAMWPKDKKDEKDERLLLSGFTYSRFSGGATWNVKERILWLRDMNEFHSQPYEQLASVYRAVGRTVEARKVCIDREWARTETLGNDRDYQRWDKERRVWLRFWHRMWGWTTGFGFEPARALWIFAMILVAAGFFFWWAGASGVMEPTDRTATASATKCTDEYPCYQPFLYAADVMIPIVDLDQREAWTTDVARAGGTLVRWVTVFLIVAGWVLTAAFIAAVSRTISRS